LRLSVFNNIPNPHNVYLYSAMLSRGYHLHVMYDHMPHELGRPWSLDLRDYERVIKSPLGQFRAALRADRVDDAVVFSGSYVGWAPLARRLGLITRNDRRFFWGERLSPKGSLVAARRLYLHPFSAILAVGRWARLGYRMVIPARVPVHVLPYTTDIRSTNRILASRPTVGFAGSLIPRKGVRVLLCAVGALPPSRRPVLEIAGSGPDRRSLEGLAADLGLAPTWLGELSAGDLDAARARWWVQAVPSRYDGWGVVVSEALAAGVPVLASTATGAARDLVRNNFNGMIVPDERSWAQALSTYSDAARVVREGANARLVGEEMAPEKAAAWLDGILTELPKESRCFVTEAWTRVQQRTGEPYEARGRRSS
jgi:glycosyltransferase involved in cell wall biosynthesis